MRTAAPAIALLALVFAATACGEPSAQTPTPAAPGDSSAAGVLAGRTFLSTEVTVAGEPHQLVGDSRVSLRFHDDGRLSAGAGCNTISGQVDTGDGRLALDSHGMTAIGCDQARHDQDEWLSGVLADAPTWELDGDTLVVRAGDTRLVLRDREVAEPDLPLRGTTWEVTSVTTGPPAGSGDDAAASVSASALPEGAAARLTFRKDTVEIFAGCNSGSADYTRDGDTLRFGKAVTTLKACSPEVMELEKGVLDVVRDEITFEITADTLALEHPSGNGLQLKGQRA